MGRDPHQAIGAAFTSESGIRVESTLAPSKVQTLFHQTLPANRFNLYQVENLFNCQNISRCKVKFNGPLVPVSSTIAVYTFPNFPSMSSSSSTCSFPGFQGASFVLRCFQHYFFPAFSYWQCHWHRTSNTSVMQPPGPLVLECPQFFQDVTADRGPNCLLDRLNLLAYHL